MQISHSTPKKLRSCVCSDSGADDGQFVDCLVVVGETQLGTVMKLTRRGAKNSDCELFVGEEEEASANGLSDKQQCCLLAF